MSFYDSTFNGIFFLSLGTLICGGVSVMLGYCFKSKCSRFRCCFGIVDIVRDVVAENEEIQIELDHKTPPDNSTV